MIDEAKMTRYLAVCEQRRKAGYGSTWEFELIEHVRKLLAERKALLEQLASERRRNLEKPS